MTGARSLESSNSTASDCRRRWHRSARVTGARSQSPLLSPPQPSRSATNCAHADGGRASRVHKNTQACARACMTPPIINTGTRACSRTSRDADGDATRFVDIAMFLARASVGASPNLSLPPPLNKLGHDQCLSLSTSSPPNTRRVFCRVARNAGVGAMTCP